MLELNSYEELINYIKAFRAKKINLLVIVSRGGLAKSTTVENALIEEAPLIFSGHVTPLSLYKELWEKTEEEKDCFVIFDDVDTLMMNKTNVSLMKQICDTKQEKTVRYSSTSGRLGGAPREFETSCKCVLLTNTLKPNEPNMRALMTRGHHINFNPSNESILEYMRTWATNKKILDFFEKFCHYAKNFNMRTYVLADELDQSGIAWQKFVIEELEINQKLLIIHELLQKYGADDIKMIEEYSGSRADFYKWKKLYMKYCIPKVQESTGNLKNATGDKNV